MLHFADTLPDRFATGIASLTDSSTPPQPSGPSPDATALPSPSSTAEPGRFDPFSLILGWMLPGLGHLRLGQPRRGWAIMAGVLGLFLIGVLVGGVHVVDRKDQWLWFLPQSLSGPLALLADYLNATFVKTGRFGTPSLGRVNEMGTLFVALAGLMNLTAMIDAATRQPGTDMQPGRPVSHRGRRSDDAGHAAGSAAASDMPPSPETGRGEPKGVRP